MKTIATSADGLIKVYLISYSIYDRVYFRYNNGKLQGRSIRYDEDSEPYFIIEGDLKYYFNEIIRSHNGVMGVL